jgi:hypothetical protein
MRTADRCAVLARGHPVTLHRIRVAEHQVELPPAMHIEPAVSQLLTTNLVMHQPRPMPTRAGALGHRYRMRRAGTVLMPTDIPSWEAPCPDAHAAGVTRAVTGFYRHSVFCAWQAGDGALANVALDRALADNPRYSMALLLREARVPVGTIRRHRRCHRPDLALSVPKGGSRRTMWICEAFQIVTGTMKARNSGGSRCDYPEDTGARRDRVPSTARDGGSR